MMPGTLIRWIGLLALMAGTQARAQQIIFTASVDRNTFAVGDRIKLTVEMSNGQGSFTHPDLGGLVLVGGPFESSSFNYVNGKMSSSVSRTYLITATAPGDYTIGPAQARVGGGSLQTDPIKVHVEKGSGSTAQGGGGAAAPPAGANRDLFASISLSKNKAYVGEQVTATYTLYSRYQNLELSNYDLPALNGFWAEEIDLGNTTWEDQLEVINGLQYRVAVLKKQLLFPQKSGTLRIEPMELKCLVNRSFFNRGTTVEVRSNAAELKAMDLPPAPAGFTGTVGELTMDVGADRTDLSANDAIDLKVKFSGKANLKLLDAPVIAFPSDFETYEPKVNDRITVNGAGMSGTREFQYLVIPRHEGDYILPPVVFSYFDVRSGGFRTLTSDTLKFHIGKGNGTSTAANISRPSKSDVQVLERDIRTIRTGDLHLGPKEHYLFGSWPWLAGMGAPALALLLLVGVQRRRARELADAGGRRRKSADRVARQRLKAASEALGANDRGTFYQALGKALEGYIADKFDLGVAQVEPTTIRERLGSLDGGNVAERYIRLIEACAMARFAPVESTPRGQLYEEAAGLIGTIEHALRK
jgi:hypothetical protein